MYHKSSWELVKGFASVMYTLFLIYINDLDEKIKENRVSKFTGNIKILNDLDNLYGQAYKKQSNFSRKRCKVFHTGKLRQWL